MTRTLSLSEAREMTDPSAVVSIDATTATSIGRLDAFPNLASLTLRGNRHIRDFGFLASASSLVDLGLEDLGLRAIPEEVLALKKLKVLGLAGNQLTSLESVAALRDLEELFVAGNALKELPQILETLPRLRTFDIARNYKLLSFAPLAKLGALESLSVSNAHAIAALPPELFAHRKLRVLAISIHWNAPADPLAGLDDVGTLPALETLSITGASMTALPAAFRSLAKLRILDLSDSKLLADVSAIAGLPELQELTLADCPALTDIAALRDLPKLAQVTLRKTGIVAIPASFTSLRALERVAIEHNDELRALDGLRDLPALRSLSLLTSVDELPDSLGTLTGLRDLKITSKDARIDFLGGMRELTDLFVRGVFDELSGEHPHLQRLQMFRPAGGDAWLASLGALTELDVNQPSFLLPVVPTLRKLTVGNLEGALDLRSVAAMPELTHVTIQRCDELAQLPTELAVAPALVRLELRSLERLTDLSPLSGASLHSLTITACETLSDVTTLGTLTKLRALVLERLEKLVKLPSMKDATALTEVTLRRLDVLKDVAGLAEAPSLTILAVEDCPKIAKKALAVVEAAVAKRSATVPATAKTTYAAFLAARTYESLRGKEDAKCKYRFPLWLSTPEDLLSTMESFSWLDDYRDEKDELSAMLAGEKTSLRPLAVLDWSFAGCSGVAVDVYAEEVFLVDTSNDKNPVLVWGHGGAPRIVHATFDAFLASLRDFVPAE